jgi:hypothetical protein
MVKRMYNYKSPIETTMLQVKSDIVKRLEDTTYKAVIECGVVVDKGELLKALAYDREQYEKGYGDGYRAAKAEIVRCKDCKFWFRNNGHDKNGCPITDSDIWMNDSDFCSRGERRDK